MNLENPFEVSDSCSGAGQASYSFTSPNAFRVEGNILVCGRTVVLPQVCRPFSLAGSKSTPVVFVSKTCGSLVDRGWRCI